MAHDSSAPAAAAADAEWTHRAPLPLGVIRGAVLVYANDRMAALLGGTREEVTGRPVFDFVAEHDRERVRERHARRLRGDRVPDSYEFTVRRLDGSTTLVEIFVGPGTNETLFQLIDRTARSEHSRYLHALARLGAAVQMHQSDKAVFQAMSEGLSELGIAWARVRPDGDGLRIVGLGVLANADVASLERSMGGTIVGALGVWGPTVLRAWNDGSAYLDDLPLVAARFFSDASSKEVEQAARDANLLRGIVLRLDASGEPAELLCVMASWLLPEDLPAFSLFTAQVSAALDAARVISDLSNRNAELAALNRVASAAGSVHDLDSLFTAGARELLQALACPTISIYLVDEERRRLKLAYEHGYDAPTRYRFTSVALDGPLGTLVLGGKPSVVVADAAEWGRQFEAHGVSSVALVPLVARSEVIGVLTAGFPHTVSESELALMAATAAHFAAAVEANRLFENLRSSYATLARTQQQLVHRERLAAIGELAAVVAHEVRNPLGVIFNSVGAIRRMLKDDQARTIIDILDEEANRLNHIVGDLLDFARPATPSLHTERIDAILDAAAEAALGESRPLVEVSRHYDAGLPTLRVDARLIRQAFVNLVLNAVQSMPTGGRLTLRIENDRGGVTVQISDTGAGIPADVRPRIFEPFFTTRATGTGLGLAVVKRIVDGHRGEIDVTTANGAGTTFTLKFPLDPDDAPSVDSARLI